MSNYSSKLLEAAVEALSRLPGIGRKSALRLALHLLREDSAFVENFAQAVLKMKSDVRFCKKCHNISDTELCEICSQPSREQSVLCVVQDIRDVLAVENTAQYNGLYHVLGGLISPIEGIGPQDLNIDSLLNRIQEDGVKEVILALSTTVEGDTTNFYIYRRLADMEVKISSIARGVSIGDELEYTDEITLGRSIINRLPYEGKI